MKNLLLALEKAFTLATLFLFTEGIAALVLSGGADELTIEYENTFFRISYPLVYLILLVLLGLRWRKVLAVIRCNWLIVAVIAFTACSFLWSDSVGLTLRRNLALFGTSLLGLYLASRYTFKEQIHLLAWVLGTVIILSLAFVVFIPHLGLASGAHAGAWRGIFSHKNGLGDCMVISSFTFLVLATSAQRYRGLLWGALLVSVALVLLSQSVGSLLTLVVTLSAFFCYRALRWQCWQLVPSALFLMLTLAITGGLVWFNFDNLMIALGKDPSLTGRTEIWPLAITAISQQPWLGYGYKSFWQGLDGPSAFIARAMGVGQYQAPHAHNGILELTLDIGVIGVAIFLLGFWSCLLRSLQWARSSRSNLYFWPLLFITYMVVTNASESRILIYNSFSCALYFAMAFSLGQAIEPEESEAENPYPVAHPSLNGTAAGA